MVLWTQSSIEGSKPLINNEIFGLIMNPSQTLLIPTSYKTRLPDLAAHLAVTTYLCHVGAR